MLDVIGSLLLGVVLAGDVALAISLMAIRPAAKLVGFVIPAAWTSVISVIGALGGFAPGVIGPFPAPVIEWRYTVSRNPAWRRLCDSSLLLYCYRERLLP